MFALKPISRDSIDGSLAKAERYRLLNEPSEAESICRDILAVDRGNRQARVSLILALTDQIHQDKRAFATAQNEISALEAEYDRAYYAGIVWERRAKALHGAGAMGSGGDVYDWLVNALHHFEEAERLRPAGNDDALLRWNACVRYLDRHQELRPKTRDVHEPILSE
jgi:hypothetical protein